MKVSEQPRAERAEQAAASPCPFCNHRPIVRDFRAGSWACPNCGERGLLMWDAKWPPRDTAEPIRSGEGEA